MQTPSTHAKTIATASAVCMALFTASAAATTVTFVNKCSTTINLFDNSRIEDIAPGAMTRRELPNGFNGMFRHGKGTQATLAEFSIVGSRAWFDISAIPPGPGNCKSYDDCKQATKGASGFNVPMSIEPESTSGRCRKLVCEHAQCPDAYLYPADDLKTHDCASNVPFKVVFCPSGSSAGPPPAPAPVPSMQKPTVQPATPAPPSFDDEHQQAEYEGGVVQPYPNENPNQAAPSSPASPPSNPANSKGSASFPGAKVKASFAYKDKLAGNMQGQYDMITNAKTCSKEKVTMKSPVGPMSEEVSMVFRGPLTIFNIAVFDGSKGGDWQLVSSFNKGGNTTDMVFLNNKNIDYATGARSPQGLSSADGLKTAASPQQFSGVLAEASNPSQKFAGPGITTGAEVNIMRKTKCSDDKTCKGYYDDNGYHGWGGGKKMFVTKVQMPMGSAPNQPAIWMLNAQVLRSNQYGCNCRGMGPVGGCGELDIAEVIETNDKRDKVSTHYYFYDGSNPAGKDNYAPRPTDTPTTYLTIIDESTSTIKILEIGGDDFDFSANSISASQIAQWVQ